MSTIGRRSSYSKEQQESIHRIDDSVNKAYLKGLVIDVCSISNPMSTYLPGQIFSDGVVFIIVSYTNNNIYAVSWKKSIDSLRGDCGTDDNIIGKEVTVISEDNSDHKIFDGEIIFDGNRRREDYNVSTPGYRSMSFFGGVYTDYESQLLNNKLNIQGKGEIPLSFRKG